MKWFWYSLIGFCLLMCSCKSKKVVSDVQLDTKRVSETSYLNEKTQIDTTKTVYSEQINEFKLVHEIITETEYDTDKNVAKKVTETKRTFVQDTQTGIVEEGTKGVEIHSQDTLNHFRGATQKVESESEIVKESNGLASVWERFGEVMGVGALVVIVYLCWKLKSRVN